MAALPTTGLGRGLSVKAKLRSGKVQLKTVNHQGGGDGCGLRTPLSVTFVTKK